jgi:hypothetical protein
MNCFVGGIADTTADISTFPANSMCAIGCGSEEMLWGVVSPSLRAPVGISGSLTTMAARAVPALGSRVPANQLDALTTISTHGPIKKLVVSLASLPLILCFAPACALPDRLTIFDPHVVRKASMK